MDLFEYMNEKKGQEESPLASRMLLQSGIISCLLLWQVLKNISLPVNLMGWIVQPTIAAIASSLASVFIYRNFLAQSCSLIGGTFIGILLLAIFYVSLLFALKCITLKDIQSFRG